MKYLYKILVGLTFLVPFGYIVVNAIFFDVKPDLIVYDTEIADLTIISLEEEKLLLGGKSYGIGLITLHEGQLVAVITDTDIIKVGWKYYTMQDVEGVLKLVEKPLIEETQGYKIPMSVVFGAVGLVFALLIIKGKMKFEFKEKRVGAMIVLWITYGAFLIIDTIVSNMLQSLFVVSIAWTLYTVEYLINKGIMNSKALQNEINKLGAKL